LIGPAKIGCRDRLKGGGVSGRSTIPLLEDAFRMDIPFLDLDVGVYQLGWGGRGAERPDGVSPPPDRADCPKMSVGKVR
jgi:hypothetical protein